MAELTRSWLLKIRTFLAKHQVEYLLITMVEQKETMYSFLPKIRKMINLKNIGG
jgi:hypothetical protein